MMKKKYLALGLLLLFTIPTAIGGVLHYLQSLEAPLISLSSALTLTDMESNPISAIPTTSLYLGEIESIYFIAHNQFDEDLDVTISLIWSGTGFKLADGGVIGIDLGSGFISQDLDVPFTLPLGDSVTVGIAIEHDVEASAPGLTIDILAE